MQITNMKITGKINHENEAFIPEIQELAMKAKAAILKATGEQA